MSSVTAPPKKVDKNSVRAGAGISAVVLLVSFVLGWHGAVPAMAIALGAGALLGLRYSPLGGTYRIVKKTTGVGFPVEPEDEAPPRFAQLIGFVALVAATLAFWPFGADAVGWALALLVASLQTLLAATGLCVGCEIYLFTRRLSAKGA